MEPRSSSSQLQPQPEWEDPEDLVDLAKSNLLGRQSSSFTAASSRGGSPKEAGVQSAASSGREQIMGDSHSALVLSAEGSED